MEKYICILLLLSVLPLIALASPITTSSFLSPLREDPNDFSWVHSWTAIGDSFAAGIGAGSPPQGSKDVECSRYGDAYPVMLSDLMENPGGSFSFLACTGATSADIKDQAKTLAPKSQDLLTISAGGNDVGFSTVLKKCIYFPSSEPDCDAAIKAASSLVETNLQSNIEGLLDAVLPAMKDNGIIAYTLYAQFFNDRSTACNDQSWVLFDPTGHSGREFGLKLTTQRRQKLNEMVQAANARIRQAITSFQLRAATAHTQQISVAIVDWDAYVPKIKGRFCEDGAALNPDDNRSLVFQRQDQTPRFIPPEKITQDTKATRETDTQHTKAKERSWLPDNLTRRFHPNTLGHSIIAQITLNEIVASRIKKLGTASQSDSCVLYPKKPTCKPDARTVIAHPKFDEAVDEFCKDKAGSTTTPFESNKALELHFSAIGGSKCDVNDCSQSMNNLYDQCSDDHGTYRGAGGLGFIGGEGSFSSACGIYTFKMTDSTPKFPPGADVLDPTEAIVKPWCSQVEAPFVPQADLNSAISDYCNNYGKPFFKGEKQIGHAIGTSPETHIYTEGTDISKTAGVHYKYGDVCEGFDGNIRQDDCMYGFRTIMEKCTNTAGTNFPGGSYTYNCATWWLSPYPQ